MSDSDLRRLLATLDDVEPAPADLVERVWRDVESLLADDDRTSSHPRRAELEVVVDDGEPSPRRRSRAWLAIAAVVLLLLGVAIGASDRFRSGSDDVAVGDAPSDAAEPGDAGPDTIQEACEVFSSATADHLPFGDPPGPDASVAIGAWVDALGSLLADVERLGVPEPDSEQVLTLRLLRTALRYAELSLADGDLDGASVALANAAGHRDSLDDPATPLGDCFEPAR